MNYKSIINTMSLTERKELVDQLFGRPKNNDIWEGYLNEQ